MIKLYLVMLAAFLAVDLVWLGVVARAFYRRHLGFLLAPAPNWAAAIVFYLIFVAGLLVFAVAPGLRDGSLRVTLLHAAFYGFVTYATYDLTNHATVNGWPAVVTLVDMAWGTVLSLVVGLAGFWAGQALAR